MVSRILACPKSTLKYALHEKSTKIYWYVYNNTVPLINSEYSNILRSGYRSGSRMHLSRAIVPEVVPKLASLWKSAKHDRLGALHWRKAERSDWEVRVRVGLDTGFMALDSIYAYICIIYTWIILACELGYVLIRTSSYTIKSKQTRIFKNWKFKKTE